MNVAEIGEIVRTRFAAQWARDEPYTFDNQGTFSDGSLKPPAGSAWVRVACLHGEAVQVEMGNLRRVRRPGVMMAQVVVPMNVGTGLAEEMCAAVSAIFELQTVDSVTFHAASVSRGLQDPPWLLYTVGVSFYADDLM